MNDLEKVKELIKFGFDHKFISPDGFEDMELGFIAERYNGIGAEWMPRFVREILTKLLRHLEPASLFHDIEFLQEDKSYFAFTKSNFRLVINAAKSGYAFSGICAGFICQLFGWGAWIDGKELISYCNYLEEVEKR